jgi:hypothetical protein
MPDFEAMTEAELRAFKTTRARAALAAREESLAAEAVLQRKRAAREAKWVRAVRLATALRLTGDLHSEGAERFMAMSDEEFDEAERQATAYGELTRDERRALAAQSTHIFVTPPDSRARVLPPTTVTGAGGVPSL